MPPSVTSKARSNMLLTHVQAAFDAQGWKYREVEEATVIEADFEAHHGKVGVHVQTFEPQRILSVVSSLDRLLPGHCLVKGAELLMRANLELTLGNFEMDWDTGRVVFRVTNVFADSEPEPAVLANLVHTAVVEMDRMIPLAAMLARQIPERQHMIHVPSLLRRTDLLPGAEPPVDRNTESPLF